MAEQINLEVYFNWYCWCDGQELWEIFFYSFEAGLDLVLRRTPLIRLKVWGFLMEALYMKL